MMQIISHPDVAERRLTLRLMAYWERLRGDRAMPAVNDVAPAELAELSQHCFLVKVRDAETQDYHYLHLGNSVMEAYAVGKPALDPGGIQAVAAHRLTEKYPQVVADKRPVTEEGEFLSLDGDVVKYRQCLLPLGENGEVQAIFGGMRFKRFPKNL